MKLITNFNMKILISLPVYNEELVVEKNTLELLRFCRQELAGHDFIIVISDNNSNDQTGEIGRRLASNYPEIEYIFIPQKGKGLAWKTAFLNYQADIYIVMDVDLAVDLRAVKEMVKYIGEGYDLVIGSRNLPDSRVKRSFSRNLISHAYSNLVKLILKTKISDSQCGFKAISQKVRENVLPQTKDIGFFLDTEIVIMAESQGYKIKEIPVNWVEARDERRKSTVNILETSWHYLRQIKELKKKS